MALVAVVFVALAIASPETLTVTAKNPWAWLFIVLVVALSAGITVIGTRVLHRPLLARALALIPVVAAMVWGFLPAFQDETVVQAAPPGLPAAATEADSTTTPAAAPTPPPAPAPVELGSDGLQSLDYQASGVARLIQLADGELLVRFEGLDVENGPDYVVYLVPGADQRAPGNGTFLGALQGNRGDQNYDVPSGTTADSVQTILIWCRSFSAPVANATVG